MPTGAHEGNKCWNMLYVPCVILTEYLKQDPLLIEHDTMRDNHYEKPWNGEEKIRTPDDHQGWDGEYERCIEWMSHIGERAMSDQLVRPVRQKDSGQVQRSIEPYQA